MTTSDPREALDRVKAREEARGYAVAHEDREAVRLTTIESQKDVGPLAEALEAVLDEHEPIHALDYNAPVRGKQHTHVCTGCGQDNGNWQYWPCPTVRAIEAKLSEGDA